MADHEVDPLPEATLPEKTEDAVTVLAEDAAEELSVAESVEITGPEEFQQATGRLKRLKRHMKQVEEALEPHRKTHYERWQAVVGLKKQLLGDLQDAEGKLKAEIKRWRLEKEREQEERERQLQAEAEAARSEELDPQETAEQSEATDLGKVADDVREEAEADGITYRDNWKVEVEDLQALAETAADPSSAIPLEVIQPNAKQLREIARSVKDQVPIPGLNIYNDPVVAARVD